MLNKKEREGIEYTLNNLQQRIDRKERYINNHYDDTDEKAIKRMARYDEEIPQLTHDLRCMADLLLSMGYGVYHEPNRDAFNTKLHINKIKYE